MVSVIYPFTCSYLLFSVIYTFMFLRLKGRMLNIPSLVNSIVLSLYGIASLTWYFGYHDSTDYTCDAWNMPLLAFTMSSIVAYLTTDVLTVPFREDTLTSDMVFHHIIFAAVTVYMIFIADACVLAPWLATFEISTIPLCLYHMVEKSNPWFTRMQITFAVSFLFVRIFNGIAMLVHVGMYMYPKPLTLMVEEDGIDLVPRYCCTGLVSVAMVLNSFWMYKIIRKAIEPKDEKKDKPKEN